MWLAQVYVTLKPVVKDPQGQAIQGGLHNLGFESVQSVRVGKFLEIRLEADSKESAEQAVRDMCAKLLANPIIEESRFQVVPTE